MTNILKFVDKIHATPTVRLDLNSGTWSFLVEGHDFSPPALRRAVAQTMMRSGGTVAAAEYDNRTLRFRLALQAASADLAATEVQKLARELDRRDTTEFGGTSNYLKWQPGTSAPVFFRTFRSEMGSIRELPPNNGVRFFDLEVLAEPFAYGLRENAGSFTVTNNPAAGSNGMFFDLTGVKGDVDTPLILGIDGAGLWHATNKPVTVVATRRRGTPANAPFALQIESMTLTNDTSTQSNSASFSGAGSNYVRTTFATVASMAKRASVTEFPAAASVDTRGQYRVFARYRLNSAAAGNITLRLKWGATTASISNGIVTPPSDSGIALCDLGFVVFPIGGDPVREGGTEIPVRGQLFEVHAQRLSGSGTLDLDYLLFVPADDQTAIYDWNQTVDDSIPDTWVVHGPTETIYGEDSSGNNSGLTQPAGLRGGFISARPGVTNRVYFLRHVENQAGGDSVTATTAIQIYYYPQYLYVRPATT